VARARSERAAALRRCGRPLAEDLEHALVEPLADLAGDRDRRRHREQARKRSAQPVGIDVVDARHQLGTRPHAAAHPEVLRSILEAAQRPFAVAQQAHQDLVARTFETDRIDVLDLRREQARDLDEQLVEVLRHRRRLDREQSASSRSSAVQAA
jgi:hypothetical protein